MDYQSIKFSNLLDQLLEAQPSSYFEPAYSSSTPQFDESKTYLQGQPFDEPGVPKYLLRESNLQKKSSGSILLLKQSKYGNDHEADIIKSEVCRNLNFDDAPVGKSNAVMSEAMISQSEQNTDKMTVQQKLKAKNVKVRMVGFDHLYQIIISKNTTEFKSITDSLNFSKFLKQSNPGCFQKTLNCYREGVLAGWINPISEQIKQLIQNAYGSSKPTIKKTASDLIQFYFEQGNQSSIECIVLEGLKSKNSKSLGTYVNLITQLLSTYGIKKLNYLKAYYGEMVSILNNQKSNTIKADALSFLKQAVKWIGMDFVLQYCQTLKQSSRKQIQRFWQGHDKSSMVPKKGKIQTSTNHETISKKEEVNIYDIADQVDVLRKFPEKWTDQVLNTQKWSDKTALLQQMIDACNIPKIAVCEYRHILEMIKRLLNDSNQNVVILSLRLLKILSKGLRRNFSSAVRSIVSAILIKFRQKKTQLIDQVVLCLDAMLISVPIEEIVEDIRQALNDKNPQLKQQLLEWINNVFERAISEKKQGSLLPQRQKDGYRAIELIVEKLNTDGTSQVRQAAKRGLQLIAELLDKQYSPEIKSESKIQSQSQLQSKNHSRNNSRQKRKSAEKQPRTKNNNISVISNASTYKSKQQQSQSSLMVNTNSSLKVDISFETSKIIVQLNQSDWEKRKSALDGLQAILDRYPTISQNGIHDLLMVLKSRINDANKQLSRQAISIIARIIQSLGRESKIQARLIVPSLIDTLAQKNESIRRECISSLTLIRNIVGADVVLHPMSLCLENEKLELKMEILKFFLSSEQHLAFSKQFVKGVIHCLCDKNKQIRSLAEKVFEKSWEIVGLATYKNASKDKPSFMKQLGDLFQKFEKQIGKNSRTNSSQAFHNHEFTNKLASPRNQTKHLPPSNKKSLGLNKTMVEGQKFNQIEHNITIPRDQYEGQDHFAPAKTLTANRMQRLVQDERKKSNFLNGFGIDIQETMNAMKQNIRKDIVVKMISLDYQQANEAGNIISKMCKDLTYQTILRQVYDILLKWIYIRLWGGNTSLSSLFQIVPQLLAILQKKSIMINQYEVDMVLSIVREYFISVENVPRELIDLTIRCLLKVNKGDKVTKSLVKHFSSDINLIHPHAKKDSNHKYREFLVGLIRTYLMEYLDSQQVLTEIVKIKELVNNEQFINKLYSMFNQNWLNEYGFRRAYSEAPSILSNRSVQSVFIQPKKERREPQERERSVSKNQKQKMMKKVDSDLNISVRSLSKTPKAVPKSQSFLEGKKGTITPTSKKAPSILKSPSPRITNQYELPLHTYASPNQMNPIYEHLHNLCPASESACTFFETLFIQTSEKISNQLEMYSKIIIGSIFKGLVCIFEHRNQVHPEKIIQQIVLLQQAVKNKHIISNCQDIMYIICDYILNQLVEEDENKFLVIQKLKERGIEFNVEKIGKMLNVCMLRILEFSEPNNLLLILFKLLTKSLKTRFVSSPRLPSLILKCVYKMTQNYLSKIKQFMLPALLQQFHNYNVVVSEINIQKDEGSTRILNILTGIVQQVKEGIWTHYQKAGLPHDNFIIRHLKTLNISKQKPKNASSLHNEELKKITLMLSKSKTYETGIILLSTFLDKHPEFQITQYYLQQQYDHKFIARVLASLESREKRALKRDGSEQQNSIGSSYLDYKDNSSLMQKIRSLKQKREDNQQVFDRHAVKSREKYSPRELIKANDIKKKITEMGYKMGNAMK